MAGGMSMEEAKTLDRVKAEHLSAVLREQLGLRPDEDVKLTVEPIGQPRKNWLLEVYGSWQGPETAEELIASIYGARTQTTREVDLESE
jgi:hypothetical protein